MCCNYFYINVKWPLTCILICIKAHLLGDKQIPSVGIFDEAKSVTFLRGHLSLNSWFIGQILPQIVSFVNLGTWEANSGKGRILDHFGRFLAQVWRKREKSKKCQVLHLTELRIPKWRRQTLEMRWPVDLWWPGRIWKINTQRRHMLKNIGRHVLS